MKAYDGRFKDLFQEVSTTPSSRADFEDSRPDLRASADRRYGRLLASSGKAAILWACKNYDGDVQSDTVAQGFGSLGLMTSRV